MCIFLPDARDGLPNLVDMIASRPGFLHEHLPMRMIDVKEFQLPKFKLAFEQHRHYSQETGASIAVR
jgi:serpin B